MSDDSRERDEVVRVELLTLGDELLRGDVVDGNAAWLGARLHAQGLEVHHVTTVGDAEDDIVAALRAAAHRARVVVVSGGLGPTDDDRTFGAVARVAGVERFRSDAAFEHIKELFERTGRRLTPNNESQAWVPAGADVLINDKGTAPAIHLSLEIAGQVPCEIFCLPGVPRELRWLYDRYVDPWLGEHLEVSPPERRTLKIFGLGESTVDHRLADLLTRDRRSGEEPCEVSLHYRAVFPENHVTLLVHPRRAAREVARSLAHRLAEEANKRLGFYVFSRGGETFPEALVRGLRDAEASVALAESCTGGRAADLLTNASGSSEVFQLGIVAYANAMKRDLLSVPPEVLDRQGAVSKACVEAMAQGVRRLAGATYGVAISGIAGPDGGTRAKPVGTVYFALDSEAGTRHLHRIFPYDRDWNKELAAYVALWLVHREIHGDPGGTGSTDLLDGRWRAGERDG